MLFFFVLMTDYILITCFHLAVGINDFRSKIISRVCTHTESGKPPKISPHGRMFRGLNESLKHWVEVQYLKRKPHASEI